MAEKTVLVIEDNPKNLKLVRTLLVIEQYKVLEAETAEKGLGLAADHMPSLILMDIQLPGIDGIEALKKLRDDENLQGLVVVALTSYAMEGDRERILNAGFDGYLSKPIDTRTFINDIEKYAGRSETEIVKPAGFVKRKTRGTILVVDDEPKNLKLMQGILESGGYDIFCAESGEKALELAAECKPDLLLLDIMMPGIDGYEVTRRLKQDQMYQDIPVILVTALDGHDDKIKGMEAGAEEFLTKPVNPVEIEARVESMLKLKRYRDQLDIRSESKNIVYGVSEKNEAITKEYSSFKILIVEDNEKDLKLLRSHLVGITDNVDIARSGSEAIKMISEQNYDLALVDILLPEMDGFEVCRHIKWDKDSKDIQVLILTCLSDLKSKIRGVELGADDYVIKPCDPREIAVRIKALLKKKAYIDGLHALNEKVQNSALRDGLTGLYNHLYFKKFLELEIKRSARQDHTTALLMMDLDDFKKINDLLGHTVGDKILQQFSSLLQEIVREIDVAARYGGEEFAVVMPYGDYQSINKIGSRINKAALALDLPDEWKKSIEKVSVSIGGAIYPNDADSAEELIEKADYMLYKAKRAGKNQLVCTEKVSHANQN